MIICRFKKKLQKAEVRIFRVKIVKLSTRIVGIRNSSF